MKIHTANSPFLDLRIADCMDLMKGFPDGHFDLAIVDPPYGIGIVEAINRVKGGVKHAPKKWDDDAPPPEYFAELRRVSRNQIIWGANYFIDRMPLASPCWIVWDKNNGASLFADAELAWASFDTPVRLAKIHWCGSAAIHETGQNKIHPTQKPIALYRWLLDRYAKPGMRILDTHLGSGSHAIACHYAGCYLTACEIDPDYFQASLKMIEKKTRQLTLFAPEQSEEHEQIELI